MATTNDFASIRSSGARSPDALGGKALRNPREATVNSGGGPVQNLFAGAAARQALLTQLVQIAFVVQPELLTVRFSRLLGGRSPVSPPAGELRADRNASPI